jgi:DinB superfamily
VTDLDPLADRLDRAVTAILELGPEIEAGAPWVLSAAYGPGPESAWGPPEVLAHVSEMLPYWLGEIERILDGTPGGPSSPAPFGRTEGDEVRLAIIGRDRGVPPRELLARIAADGARVTRRLRGLSDGESGRLGLHPTRGAIPVSEVVARFLTSHLEGHLAQLRESLAAGAPDQAASGPAPGAGSG